ncbi:DNA-lyase [Schizophyllum fasciatum]
MAAPTLKRSASPLPELTARQSASNSSVTLYELASPRRSKRLKTDSKPPAAYVDSDSDDIEDAVPQVRTRPARRSACAASKVKPPSKKQTPKAARKPRVKPSGEPHPAPARWRETYDAIKEMRDGLEAAVDTMGCHIAQRGETDPRSKRLVTLVSLMLSSQTKDEVVDTAIKKLRAALGGSTTLPALLAADKATIEDAICKVGFWPKKTGYIMDLAKSLRDDFDGDVPKTAKELQSLKGVGPKMAYLCLQAAWGINDGIGVDVHVHRITNRLKYNLESWLPKELWGDINPMLVGFGQAICYPVNPRCDKCTLRDKDLCPSAQQDVSPTKRKPAAKRVLQTSPSASSASRVEIELDPDVDKPLLQ